MWLVQNLDHVINHSADVHLHETGKGPCRTSTVDEVPAHQAVQPNNTPQHPALHRKVDHQHRGGRSEHERVWVGVSAHNEPDRMQ